MSERVVLVDLGSNGCRLLLVEVSPGVGFRVLREERAQTRLADGAPDRLPRTAIAATVQAVHRFLASVRNGAGPRVVAVATSAVRDAANRDVLLERLRERDGIDVSVLTGAEEARLGARAALMDLPLRDGLVIDLGGGSLQLTRVRQGALGAVASIPLGCVRLTRRFLRHDPVEPRELRRLRREIRDCLLETLPPAARGDELVGQGGTVRALARMHLATRGGRESARHGLRLRASDVTAVREQLAPLSVRKRRQLPGLRRDRADIILAGAVVVEELMTLGGYLTLIVSTRGVRDGILLRETFGDPPAR